MAIFISKSIQQLDTGAVKENELRNFMSTHCIYKTRTSQSGDLIILAFVTRCVSISFQSLFFDGKKDSRKVQTEEVGK